MIPHDLFQAFPQAMYLLPAVLLLLYLFYNLFEFRKEILAESFHPDSLKHILIPRSRINFIVKAAAIALVWILATLALMQPQGNGRYPLEQQAEAGSKSSSKVDEVIVKRKAHDVIFLVDASASMGVKDTRTGESRLDAAKEIVDEIVSRLRGESVALYAFTSDTTRLSPPTMDYLFVRLVSREMTINEGDIAGTSLVEALSDMKDAFFSKPTAELKTLVLLTDGGDTSLEGVEGEARTNQINIMLNFLKDAQENNLRVFTIGMGSEQGSQIPDIEYEGKPVFSTLDEQLLQKISEKGRGAYYFANQWPAIDLAAEITNKMGEDAASLEEFKIKRSESEVKGGDDLIYDLYFQIPLGFAIFILGWALLFPDSRVRR